MRPDEQAPEEDREMSSGNPSPLAPRSADSSSRIHASPVLYHDPVGTCPYCGAALSGHLFFCQVCGKAYREAPGSKAMPPPKTISDLIAERAPSFWPVLWSLAIALFVAIILSFLLFFGDDYFHPYSLVISTITLGLTTTVLTVKYFSFLNVALKRIGFDRGEAWLGLLLLFPLLGLNWLWHGPVLEGLGADDRVLDYDLLGLSVVGSLLFLCILPSITEEISFRGLLQPMLGAARGEKTALLLVSTIFAAFHFSAYSFPYLFLVGLLLGWVRWKTGSLYPPILLHFVHNTFVVLLMTP